MSRVAFKFWILRVPPIPFGAAILLSVLPIAKAETSVALWQGDKEAAVSITFDDGLLSQFDNAFPLLQQRGLKGTFFIISNDIDFDYIGPLVIDGQEIGSHSVSHPNLTKLKKNQKLDEELGTSQLILQGITGQDVVTFAYPYGEYNQDVINITDDYYIAGRTAFPYALNSSSPPLYELNVVGPYGPDGNADPIVYLKSSVDDAVAENEWAIEMFHEIDNPSGWDNVSAEDFSAHIDYLVANDPNVWVAPMGTVSEYIYERDAASVTTLFQDSSLIQLDLYCGLDSRFDTPLTLFTDCPSEWETREIMVKQGQIEQVAKIVSKYGSLYVMYNAVPDAGTIELSPGQLPISGYIRNACGTPIKGVTVTADNGGTQAITGVDGFYEVWVSVHWFGHVTAIAEDYTFTPSELVYSDITQDDHVGDFSAQLDADIDNSCDVGLPDLVVICENWLSPGDLSTGDLDESGFIDLLDVAEFSNVWSPE